MNRDRILDEYRNGDQGRRMCLFFSYRELREEFDTIEQECPQDLTLGPVSPEGGSIPQKRAASLQALSYYLRSHLLPNHVRR